MTPEDLRELAEDSFDRADYGECKIGEALEDAADKIEELEEKLRIMQAQEGM